MEVGLDSAIPTCSGSLGAGVALWLNTPERLLAASGTSRMKAALNGGPNLSVLDSRWIEGHLEGVNGRALVDNANDTSASEANSLHDKLEHANLPLHDAQPDAYAEVRRSAVALNGSCVHIQCMVHQYVRNPYRAGES